MNITIYLTKKFYLGRIQTKAQAYLLMCRLDASQCISVLKSCFWSFYVYNFSIRLAFSRYFIISWCGKSFPSSVSIVNGRFSWLQIFIKFLFSLSNWLQFTSICLAVHGSWQFGHLALLVRLKKCPWDNLVTFTLRRLIAFWDFLGRFS